MNRAFQFILSMVFILMSSTALATEQNVTLRVNTPNSLIRIGVAPLKITEDGKSVAAIALDAVSNNDKEKALNAIKKYDELISKENISGDYLGLKWLLTAIFSSPDERNALMVNDIDRDYYDFFTQNNCEALKEYLQREYNLIDFSAEDQETHLIRRNYLNDMIMFNNPWREKWEKSSEIIKNIPLHKGDKILDIGSGFGFYSYRFSDIVGDKGKVYAIDIMDTYINYLNTFNEKYNYTNVSPVLSKSTDISVDDQADVAFICSLYHVIHSWSPERERRPFLNSIKRALKTGGYLVIADNAFANGKELHNLYVYKELIQAQLHFYGFSLEKTVDITPLRYVMIFKHEAGELSDLSIKTSSNPACETQLEIKTSNSIIHIGSLDSYDITESGIEAAKIALKAIETKNPDTAREAIARYNDIIPLENFGGEYTAFRWFCEYLAAPETRRAKMLEDPLDRAYYNFLAKDDYDLLKSYIKYKYKLVKDRPTAKMDGKDKPSEEDREVGRTRRAFLEDFILFNNPERNHWENSKKIMDLLPFKAGDRIADIGSGSGYYSYRFSRLVGDEGKVFALDIKKDHITFLNDFVKKEGIKNLVPIKNEGDDFKINEKVDYAFMCSLYHIIYGVDSQKERETFIDNIKKILKKNGVLYIVDNGPVKDRQLPYHGPYITKELIIAQLAHYGFTFEEYHQIIPQRYMLTFRMTND
ncbi:class I SAM-dependent methyltransferase [Desulfobacter postgatei]|uniref:class I SAM-dependent methyltransferase n=1 Tax=Desulfobacter postgatei TaxID=2293 RepID=UPI00259B03E6|nr:class I SAM-dependent methyltransferase [uncultured Desulfobacter sp.]